MSPYAKSKYEAEKLCKEYAAKYAFNTTCLRYFNVYGNRQNPQGVYAAVVAQFKNNLLTQKPLTIYGDGTQTRDFINVDEVVQANIRLALLKKSVGEVFNIGSGKSMNLFELIATVSYTHLKLIYWYECIWEDEPASHFLQKWLVPKRGLEPLSF